METLYYELLTLIYISSFFKVFVCFFYDYIKITKKIIFYTIDCGNYSFLLLLSFSYYVHILIQER